MPPALGWADLAGRRVGLWGLGVEGRAALERLEGLGGELVLVDDEAVALDRRQVLITDEGGLEALLACEVVVKSPGISRRRPEVAALEAAGIPVVGGLGLSLHELDRSKVVCVTGTKGKSTTTSVLGHLAAGLGLRVEVRGNIGRPPFDPGLTDELDLLVVETSSFQATDVTEAPGLVVITALGEDHVDWHGDPATYRAEKLALSAKPGARATVAQGRDATLRAHAPLLGGRVTWSDELAGPWARGLGLLGEHNLANAELARVALVVLGVEGAEDEAALAEAARGYEPLAGRLQLVAEVDGVRYVDDSLATNPLPTLAALEAFAHDPVALLLGGYDRGVDYAALLDALAARTAPTLVVGLPDSGARLVAALEARGALDTALAGDVAEAVGLARAWAPADGVVLLSPAAPSFSQFSSWKERSEAFRAAVGATR
jgi:UDP-N-acetylmuramoyl-L-alanine---L-glutamate ligase